jgi:hypothetical protein
MNDRDGRSCSGAVDLDLRIELFSECLNQVCPEANIVLTAPSLGKAYPVV